MNPKFPTSDEWINLAWNYIIWQIELNRAKFIIKNMQETNAIFLAWAPWSGKTEFIQSVLQDYNFFFIDIDSYRDLFEWYHWNNASSYQLPISKVINQVLKYCFDNKIRFILDGTFKSWRHSLKNIETCHKNKWKVDIYLLFQNPLISYYYTFLRQIQHKRNIPVDWFVDCFYRSIDNVFIARDEYSNVSLYLCSVIHRKKNKFIIQELPYGMTIENFCKENSIWYTAENRIFINRLVFEKTVNELDNKLRILSPILKIYLSVKRYIWQRKN